MRIQLKDNNGKPLNPDLPNRRKLLHFLGASIPRLKSRGGQKTSSAPAPNTGPLAGGETATSATGAGAGAAADAGSSGGAAKKSGNKKKGRKGK